MARGHPPPHCENTQVLREAITEDDDDDDDYKALTTDYLDINCGLKNHLLVTF